MKRMCLSPFCKVCMIANIPLLFTACTGTLDDALDNEIQMSPQNSSIASADSILQFATIEEFRSISADKLSTNYPGYQITELTYECVDTIDLRALRFDVTAKLVSAEGTVKTVKVRADVGPELVSVEYYPTGEWITPHDNMAYAFYPCVERYRNYSDGSRIGPDRFYDYGHFSFTRGQMTGMGTHSDSIVLNWSETLEHDYYEEGILYTQHEGVMEINMNAVMITEDGQRFSGEDLVPHPVSWWKEFIPAPGTTAQDRFFYALGNYYANDFSHIPQGTGYRPSRIIDSDDETSIIAANICRDVPDVSPVPYPIDTMSLNPGWYFAPIYDFGPKEAFAFSDYHKYYFDRDWKLYGEHWLTNGMTFSCGHEKYLQYLVIDGRIIHYDNLVNDYDGILNLERIITETKTDDGYKIHREMPHSYLGSKFKYLYDLHIKCVNGPAVVIDNSSYYEMEVADRKEYEKNLMTQSSTRSDKDRERNSKVPRSDGKYIEIDHCLPSSIQEATASYTLIPTRK